MLMDNAADAVFVADYRTERWVYVNDRFESLLGYSREELLAGNIYDAVTPAFRNSYRERFRSIALAGGVSTREIRLNRKDGSEVQLEMNARHFAGWHRDMVPAAILPNARGAKKVNASPR